MAAFLEVISQHGVRLITAWRVPVQAGPKCIVLQVDLRFGAADRIVETRQLCFRAFWGSAVIEVIVEPDESVAADRQYQRDASERRQEGAPMVAIARNYNEMPACPGTTASFVGRCLGVIDASEDPSGEGCASAHRTSCLLRSMIRF